MSSPKKSSFLEMSDEDTNRSIDTISFQESENGVEPFDDHESSVSVVDIPKRIQKQL